MSDIAKSLDIPVGTVGSRLHHATRRMRDSLELTVVPGAPGTAGGVMNEDDFECELGEWIHADRVEASAWVPPSVVEHARRHSNQGHGVRLRGWLASLLLGAGRSQRAVASPVVRLAAGVTVAFVIVLALGLLLPTTRTSPEHQPAFLPAPELAGLERDTGAIGSLWLERADGRPDSHITLHPDGTIVRPPSLRDTRPASASGGRPESGRCPRSSPTPMPTSPTTSVPGHQVPS